MTRLRSALLCALLCNLTLPASAGMETFSGRQAWEMSRKAFCGTLEAGRTRYGVFRGRAYSRVPGEPDRHIFDILGVNTRQCATVQDAERGEGFRSVSREVMLYLDPKTGDVIDRWTNPWTGAEVEVVHVANDPVNMRAPMFDRNTRDIHLQRDGQLFSWRSEFPLFYDNPLGGKYQRYVGGTYHAMEIFDNYYDVDEMLDPKRDITRSWVSWVRIAQWLPWMEMGNRPGIMIINATGSSTFDRSEIPEPLLSVLKDRYPGYFEPPPLDDHRPNETSWTVFRRHIDSKAK